MKIGILTFHCVPNYGAVLQTYGLQEYLKSLGHDVYVVDYRPEYLLRPYKIFKWKWDSSLSVIQNLLFLLRTVYVMPVRLKRKKLFERFVCAHLNAVPVDLSEMHSDFDAFILGSDQIWNPQITSGLDKVYFGHFPAAEGKKVIAYAASAGNCNYLLPYTSELHALISGLRAIGVREKLLADYLQQFVKTTIHITVDPVLLAGRSVYSPLTAKNSKRNPFLLSFQLGYNEQQSQISKNIARQKGLDLVELVSATESIKQRELLTTESPESFLSLFQEAEYVVTSSFHGTIFAILFEKDFNTISFDEKHSERMCDLLNSLDLCNRLVMNGQQIIVTTSIDYGHINERLSDLRASSQTFLRDALG